MTRQNPPQHDITPKQAAYIAGRLEGKTISQASSSSGVAERTGQRWEAMPAVRAALAAGADDLLAEAARRAKLKLGAALDTLAAIMGSEAAPVGIRVAAARAILTEGPRLIELGDLAARLAALEAASHDNAEK
jgi:hypothetical protein